MSTEDGQAALPRALARASAEFEGWRESREQRRIPDWLWSQAVRVAAAHGVSRTARALRLNAQALRERMEGAASAPGTAAPVARTGFVELRMPPMAGASGYVLELESARGARLRLEVRGGGSLDVVALARSFVGGEP